MRRWVVRGPLILAALLAGESTLAAQRLSIAPDDPSGTYDIGERIGWTITVEDGARPTGAYPFTVRRDGAAVVSTGMLDLSSGRARIETVLTEPGMILVEVTPPAPDPGFGDRSTGGPGRVLIGAAVAPEEIRPALPKPADFDSFWESQIERLETIPMNPMLTPGESDRPGVEYATLRLNNINGARVHAQMAKPVGDGPFPALLIYQWASPPYPLQKSWVTDRAAEGWLVLNVQPHDVPTDMPQPFYDALPAMIRNYARIGQDSRDESHFLQMYLGDYRAIEYMASRPDWNGTTMVVMGTSMGGQQSFAMAGLNRRITGLVVHVPSGADVIGPLRGRAASYPNWDLSRTEVLQTARYFDTANFASAITARSLVSMGFIDTVSTATGIWSVFNQIQGPKEVVPLVDAHHNHLATQEQQVPYTERAAEWLAALAKGEVP